MLPGKTLRGPTSFAWAEGGAFLVMRSEIDEPEFPSGVAYIGTRRDGGTWEGDLELTYIRVR
jgi:hypothetical protein